MQRRRLMEVDLAQPRGFCAGVVRAIDIDDVPQTTLRLDHTTAIIAARMGRLNDIQRRDICYATQYRQSAVRDFSKFADVIPGVDAARGFNCNQLRDTGTEAGFAGDQMADGSAVNPDWLNTTRSIGSGAGASGGVVEDAGETYRAGDGFGASGRGETIEFRLSASLPQAD